MRALAHFSVSIYTFLVGLAEDFAQHLRLLYFAEKDIAHDDGVDELVVAKELIVYLAESGADFIEVLVEFKVAARAAFRFLSLCIPVFRSNGAANGQVGLLTVNRDSHVDLVVGDPLGSWLSGEESQGEIRVLCHDFEVGFNGYLNLLIFARFSKYTQGTRFPVKCMASH